MSLISFVKQSVLFDGFAIVTLLYKAYLAKSFPSNIGNEARRWRPISLGLYRLWKATTWTRPSSWRLVSLLFLGTESTLLWRKTNSLLNVFPHFFVALSFNTGTFFSCSSWSLWAASWWLASSSILDMFANKERLDPVSRVPGIPGWYWILGIKCSDTTSVGPSILK